MSAWFGTNKVLERVSLSMEPGKVTALIGPSGCGKSTFLRILNRMHELIPGAALSGSVTLDGSDIYGPQSAGHRDAAADRHGVPAAQSVPVDDDRPERAGRPPPAGTKVRQPRRPGQECLERAGLWREARNRLNEAGAALSGGQQQRLCIARALAVRPQVLLMDEPCSALDPISTGVIEETIRELSHEVTIVIVTHNMQQAQRVSHNCALFLVDGEGRPGHIVEAGPDPAVFGNPRDPRTVRLRARTVRMTMASAVGISSRDASERWCRDATALADGADHRARRARGPLLAQQCQRRWTDAPQKTAHRGSRWPR